MRLSAAIALTFALITPMAFAQTAPAPAPAPTAPPSAAAIQLGQKLYDDQHAEGVFDGLASNIVSNEISAAQNVAGPKAGCQALRAPVQAFYQKMQTVYSNLADAQFRQSAATVYANNLSEQEMRDIANFLESPAGKKWNAVSGQVSQGIFAIASEKVKPRDAQVRATLSDFEAQFKTALATCPAGAAQPGAPTPPPAPPKKKH